jgi:hypothetical protein
MYTRVLRLRVLKRPMYGDGRFSACASTTFRSDHSYRFGLVSLLSSLHFYQTSRTLCSPQVLLCGLFQPLRFAAKPLELVGLRSTRRRLRLVHSIQATWAASSEEHRTRGVQARLNTPAVIHGSRDTTRDNHIGKYRSVMNHASSDALH